jgi:predicted negative regulator of RcsB-dependent stress response
MRRAAELRLESGALDAAGAAAALEAVLAAWRGDAMESAVRLRLAALHMQAGAPRAAFDLLRETAEAFPELAAELRSR